MSDQRPYPRTEWEAEQKVETDLAVEKAEAAVDNADVAVAHTDAAMKDIMESSREIAANSKAVEQLTRDALIADNKRFRRRNFVLVFLTSVLILGMGYMIYRDIYINAPEREKIAQQTENLQDANQKLDDITAFIEDVQSDDGNGVTREDLEPVFKAVFDTQAMVMCVITAPDEAAVRLCATPQP